LKFFHARQVRIAGKELAPVRDVLGLRLTPDMSIVEAETFFVLLVPGGYGLQALRLLAQAF
jgi:cyclohexyl-isocyanide hydratase